MMPDGAEPCKGYAAALKEINRLTELTTNDGIEIGSYRKETGLRGELKNKDAELDAYEEHIAKLEAENAELKREPYIQKQQAIHIAELEALKVSWKARIKVLEDVLTTVVAFQNEPESSDRFEVLHNELDEAIAAADKEVSDE